MKLLSHDFWLERNMVASYIPYVKISITEKIHEEYIKIHDTVASFHKSGGLQLS
jgi:hypothetical protein